MISPGPTSDAPPTDTILATDPQWVDIGDLRIAYDERVLRPRPWTQAQSRWGSELLAHLPDGPVLELCAGAGHIGLLAVHGTERHLVAVEADPVAAAYASVNALAAGIGTQVEVRQAAMSDALGEDERFVLVLADPPYLRSTETERYPEDPLHAVDGGTDGLDLVRECLQVAASHVRPGGAVLLQVRDRAQAEEAARLATELPGPAALHPVEVRVHAGRGAVLRLDAPAG